jgi:hypothetical protein
VRLVITNVIEMAEVLGIIFSGVIISIEAGISDILGGGIPPLQPRKNLRDERIFVQEV